MEEIITLKIRKITVLRILVLLSAMAVAFFGTQLVMTLTQPAIPYVTVGGPQLTQRQAETLADQLAELAHQKNSEVAE